MVFQTSTYYCFALFSKLLQTCELVITLNVEMLNCWECRYTW